MFRALWNGFPAKSGQRRQGFGSWKTDSHSMNTITVEQQERILDLLREGRSAREVERLTGHRRETVLLYGRLAGILPVTRSNAPQAIAA